MGIYLGNIGNIEVTRASAGITKNSVVDPSDVNTTRNRFSFDFDEGFIVSGDKIEITAATPLAFIDASGWANNTVQNSGSWYVSVDELGGIKLYNSFDNSLDGSATGQIPLASIASSIPIEVTVGDAVGRLVACVESYELNTTRELVDISSLGDQFRQQYSSLITGSGRLTAQWDYVASGKEPVHYLMQLVLRTEIGSNFKAKLYIKSADTDAAGGSFSPSQFNDSLWWEFDALVTSSAVSFDPGAIISSAIDFVATGPIRLKAKTVAPSYLLQEDGGKILLEDGSGYLLASEEVA